MFKFSERLLKSCGNGCQLLWSDPNKQASGYDSVQKEDGEIDFMEEDTFDGTLENDPLTGAIIMSQPSTSSARASVWTDSPIVKNTASSRGSIPSGKPNMSARYPSSSSLQNTAMTSPIVKNTAIVKNPSFKHSSLRNSIDKATGKGTHPPEQTRKKSKKEKSEEVRMQLVSTV